MYFPVICGITRQAGFVGAGVGVEAVLRQARRVIEPWTFVTSHLPSFFSCFFLRASGVWCSRSQVGIAIAEIWSKCRLSGASSGLDGCIWMNKRPRNMRVCAGLFDKVGGSRGCVH